MSTAINIESVSEETVHEIREAIMEILNSANDQKTKRLAMKLYVKSIPTPYTTISNCVFTTPQTIPASTTMFVGNTVDLTDYKEEDKDDEGDESE